MINVDLDSCFEQALAYLTINCTLINDLGLLHGKMGIAIFFAHYSQKTQNREYKELAENIIEDICENLNCDMPIQLESGLCGIGWGIEYLVQQGFIEGEADEILADIDQKVSTINPMNMTDLSFHNGLLGIAFYVLTRLKSPNRKNSKVPFNEAYIACLYQALHKKELTDSSKISRMISCECSTSANLTSCLDFSQIPLLNSYPYENKSLGIDKGLAGVLLKFILFSPITLLPKKEHCNMDFNKSIYIFFEECTGQCYGLGTYLRQLSECLNQVDWNVTIVTLRTSRTSSILIEFRNNIRYVYIGNSIYKLKGEEWQEYFSIYYRNVLPIILSISNSEDKNLFILNNMHMHILAEGIKRVFPHAKIIASVHYMDWAWILSGNRNRLSEILSNPADRRYNLVSTVFNENMKFLSACDLIMVPARHTCDTLCRIGKLSLGKLRIIPHGIRDERNLPTIAEKKQLRLKYGFDLEKKLLVYAGRVEELKGISLLAEAFSNLSCIYPDIQLIVIGDGDFQLVQSRVLFCSSKVTLTGFLKKQEYYDFLSMSDIGILPSLYEEFGYVALDMMMVGLPLVVGNNSGLEEIVRHNENGYVLNLRQSSEERKYNIREIERILKLLINSPFICKKWGENSRKIFEKTFQLSIYNNNLKSIIEECQ